MNKSCDDTNESLSFSLTCKDFKQIITARRMSGTIVILLVLVFLQLRLDHLLLFLQRDEAPLGKTQAQARSFEQQKTVHRHIQEFLSLEKQLPPNTPGALLHIGKTGGSTLSQMLANACHSWVPKPCASVRNESYMSQLTTYYHTPDFDILNQTHYDFYVVTTRNPLDRIMSAFLYLHPRNDLVKYKSKPLGRLFDCFPTLQSFADAVGDHPNNYTWPLSKNDTSNNCTHLARAMLQSKIKVAKNHFYYNTKTVMELLEDLPNKTVLVIRTEHLWQDWISTNQWLGQDGPIAVSNFSRRQHGNNESLPVPKTLGEHGKLRLCRAIEPEYQAYLQLLRLSVNLNVQQQQSSLELAQRTCPNLKLQL